MNKYKNIGIYVFYYKDGAIPVDKEIYHPIMAGNALKPTKMAILGDSSGDSISEKNPFFSELTGIYWVWKNTKHDVTGSCHYRRYFTAKPIPFEYKLKQRLFYLFRQYSRRKGLIYTNNTKRFSPTVLNENEINEILQSYDVILPVSRQFHYSIKKHYQKYHDLKDLAVISEILKDKYPDFIPSFQKVLDGNRLYANNMFVMPQPIYNRFMSWWFDMLFEFEKRIKPEVYTGYQQRIIGFIAERLLTIWITHQNLKIKELPVIYFKKLKKD